MKKKTKEELLAKYAGKKFNHLTVIDVYHNTERGRWFFECLCDCGERCSKCMSKVLTSHTKTCGGDIHRKEQGQKLSETLKKKRHALASEGAAPEKKKCDCTQKESADGVFENNTIKKKRGRKKKPSFLTSEHPSSYNLIIPENRGAVESLEFIKVLADENNLSCFMNDNGDLEITGKSLCFHLADVLGGEKDALDRWKYYHDLGIRCVFVYPSYLKDSNRVNVYKNILIYHCGLAKRVYARNTVVRKYPAIQMKLFFTENNIEGYRNASVAYVLEDKKTGEQYMSYSLGYSYFGKGNYDCEIARGACKLGYQVVGGASKLWKAIINDNPDVKSIVYYCDRREYDQRSIGHLMDGALMTSLGHVHMLAGGTSFMNYWTQDVFLDGRIWHRAGDYANREPAKHSFVRDAMLRGECVQVNNPGSFTNIFVRTGYHLEGMSVVKDDEGDGT